MERVVDILAEEDLPQPRAAAVKTKRQSRDAERQLEQTRNDLQSNQTAVSSFK